MDIKRIQSMLEQFAVERDWNQFHSPKNLVMALAGEVGELVELFQWVSERDSCNFAHENRARVEEEIADVAIYLLQLCDKIDVSLESVVERKIEINAQKYPAEVVRGSSAKFDERKK